MIIIIIIILCILIMEKRREEKFNWTVFLELLNYDDADSYGIYVRKTSEDRKHRNIKSTEMF